ncbi:MAG: hypothetical protein LBE97_02520 [Holosporales bacterium]|jgi:hypothetical protein|nr:hypothetical protein [Holosporales bacterium]
MLTNLVVLLSFVFMIDIANAGIPAAVPAKAVSAATNAAGGFGGKLSSAIDSIGSVVSKLSKSSGNLVNNLSNSAGDLSKTTDNDSKTGALNESLKLVGHNLKQTSHQLAHNKNNSSELRPSPETIVVHPNSQIAPAGCRINPNSLPPRGTQPGGYNSQQHQQAQQWQPMPQQPPISPIPQSYSLPQQQQWGQRY